MSQQTAVDMGNAVPPLNEGKVTVYVRYKKEEYGKGDCEFDCLVEYNADYDTFREKVATAIIRKNKFRRDGGSDDLEGSEVALRPCVQEAKSISMGEEMIKRVNFANYVNPSESKEEVFALIAQPSPEKKDSQASGADDDQEQADFVDFKSGSEVEAIRDWNQALREDYSTFELSEQRMKLLRGDIQVVLGSEVCESFVDSYLNPFIYELPSLTHLVLNLGEMSKHTSNTYDDTKHKIDGILCYSSYGAVLYENSMCKGDATKRSSHERDDRNKLNRAAGRTMAQFSREHPESPRVPRVFTLQAFMDADRVCLQGKMMFSHEGTYYRYELFTERIFQESTDEELREVFDTMAAFWSMVKREVTFYYTQLQYAHRSGRKLMTKDDLKGSQGREEGDESSRKRDERRSETVNREFKPKKTPRKTSKNAFEFAVLKNTSVSKVILTQNKTVLKYHKNRLAGLREQHALMALQSEESVVRLLGLHALSMDIRVPVLELELLQPIKWMTMREHKCNMQSFMHCLISTVSGVHKKGFAHRDLKPGNIMMRRSTGRPVLLDFDSAGPVNASHDAFEQRGTPGFTFWNSPATVAWQHDSVCLGVVLGFILGVEEFADPSVDSISILRMSLSKFEASISKKTSENVEMQAVSLCRSLLTANTELSEVILGHAAFLTPRQFGRTIENNVV